MEDIAFNYPKKILRYLLFAALLSGVAWGLITGDSDRGARLYIKEVQLIATPIANLMKHRVERAFEKLLPEAGVTTQKSLENK